MEVNKERQQAFERFKVALEDMTRALIPDVEFDMEVEEDLKKILVTIDIKKEEEVGLFMGRRRFNLKVIQSFIRGQQLFPHDRLIVLNIKGRGDVQTFLDRTTSRGGKGDIFSLEADRIRRQLKRGIEEEGLTDIVKGTALSKLLKKNGVRL